MLHYMTRDQVKEILDRVRTWPPKVVRFVDQVEERHAEDDISDQEWDVIRERRRAARLGDGVTKLRANCGSAQ
jgi:hypothetical protein